GLAGIGGGGAPEVRGTDDPLLYKYFREGTFDYDIPLPAGAYEMPLGFIEPYNNSEDGDRIRDGDRALDVSANGQPLLQNYGILAEAGDRRTLVTETFPVTVAGGRLMLSFVPVSGEAIVSSIKIVRQE